METQSQQIKWEGPPWSPRRPLPASSLPDFSSDLSAAEAVALVELRGDYNMWGDFYPLVISWAFGSREHRKKNREDKINEGDIIVPFILRVPPNFYFPGV